MFYRFFMPHTPLNQFDPSQILPQHLQHKPVYAVPYQEFDGPFIGATDMRYISVGISQYDENDVSIKTMRHVDGRWTRQAEELPLHRAVDLMIFLAKIVFDRNPQSGNVIIPAGLFEGQTEEIIISRENRSIEEHQIFDRLVENNPDLISRFIALRELLNSLPII